MGTGPEVSRGNYALGCSTFRHRPRSVPPTGQQGNEAFDPLLNHVHPGYGGIIGVRHRSLGIEGLVQVLEVGLLAGFVPERSRDIPGALYSDRRPMPLAPIFLRAVDNINQEVSTIPRKENEPSSDAARGMVATDPPVFRDFYQRMPAAGNQKSWS